MRWLGVSTHTIGRENNKHIGASLNTPNTVFLKEKARLSTDIVRIK